MKATFEEKAQTLIDTLKQLNIKFKREYIESRTSTHDTPLSYSGNKQKPSDTLYGISFEHCGRSMIFLESGLHYDNTNLAIEILNN